MGKKGTRIDLNLAATINDKEYQRQQKRYSKHDQDNKPSMMVYRTFYDITYDLLWIIKHSEYPINRSRAMYYAGISYTQVKQYLADWLIPQGLIEFDDEDPKYLLITPKAEEYMNKFEELRKLMGIKNPKETRN